MLINSEELERIKRTDRIADYDAFILKKWGVQSLYIKIIDGGTSIYLKIQNNGEFGKQTVCGDTTFELFLRDDCCYPVDISSIKFDKILYRLCLIEEAKNIQNDKQEN